MQWFSTLTRLNGCDPVYFLGLDPLETRFGVACEKEIQRLTHERSSALRGVQ